LAILAACRYIAHHSDAKDGWMVLSDAFEAVSLGEVAVSIAAYAVRGSLDDDSVVSYAGKLANVGRFQQALKILGKRDAARSQAMRAYILLRLNNPLEAARLLRRVEIDPDWGWA